MSERTDLVTINSDRYWDKRFSEDWDEMGGPLQSRFFARLALDMLPNWIVREIRHEKLTVVDWGCAEGDGTDVLAETIDKSQLFGVDISRVAIDIAGSRYSGITFKEADFLDSENDDSFDIVFSSNTLEHFHAPSEVLQSLSKRAGKALILLLPYRELSRIDEHFTSFTPGNIVGTIGNRFSLVFSRVCDCSDFPDSQWLGEQILLIYADNSWVSSLSLVLGDYLVESEDVGRKIGVAELSFSNEVSRAEKLKQELIAETARAQKLEEEVAFYSKEVGFQEQKLEEFENIRSELIFQKNQNDELVKSNSWKFTAPLRFLSSAYGKKNKIFYSTAKWIYWHLPFFVRQHLHGARHSVVRRFRDSQKVPDGNDEFFNSTDLSWLEFKNNILSERSSYKGVFIQELVIDWNVPLYQRPQHVSAAMGRLGYLVIYRTDNWAGDDVNGFREVEDNVWVTNRHEVDEIKGALRSIYSTAYANTVDYLKSLKKNSALVYEYIDHIDPEISGDEKNIKRLMDLKEFAFNGGVNYVVASANQLYNEAVEALGEDRVILAQNGVDTRHYRNIEHDQISVPQELEKFCNRHEYVVGYFGALAPWLWYEVIAELIEKRKDLGFVFIGPDYYGGSAKLAKESNVLYLGPVDYKVLPAYAKCFDVCFIPFKPGDIAKTTSPLKLFEYFALEKPVVVTSDMRECVQYPEVFRGGDVKELSSALSEAITIKDDPAFKQRMAELADENDWDQRAKAISRCFENL